MAVRNHVVVQRWKDDESASNHTTSLTTNGKSLWSYDLKIGDTCSETGIKILRGYRANTKWGFQSQTTSCHVGLAARVADLVDE